MATTIDNLEIKIAASAPDASGAIDRLVTSLSGMKSSLKGGVGSLNTIAKQIDRLGESIRNFPDVTNLEKARDVLSDLKGIGKVSVGVGNTSSAAEPKGGWYTIPNQGETIKDLGKGTADGANAITGAANKAERSVGSLTQALSGAISPINSFREGLKKLSLSFGRIAKLMVIRKALQAVMKEVGEGFKRLYEWDKKLGSGRFSSAMDDMAASARYLGNAVATTLSPIMTALAPIIHRVADAVVFLLNAVQGLFAVLLRQKSVTIAKRNADEYSASLTNAGKAAKKLKDLLAFDEINRLSDKSSGGGGGGSLIDFSDAFEEVDLDTFLGQCLNKLDEFWRNAKKKIGKWMSDLRNNLPDWAKPIFDSIFPGWQDFADKLQSDAEEKIDYTKQKFLLTNDEVRNQISTKMKEHMDTLASYAIGKINKGLGHATKETETTLETLTKQHNSFHDGLGRSFDATVDSNVKYAEDKSSDMFSTIQQGGGHAFGEMSKSLTKETDGAVITVKGLFGGLGSIFKKDLPSDWSTFVQGLSRPFQKVMNEISKLINKYMIDPLNTIIKKFNEIFGTNWKTIPRLAEMIGEHGGGGRGFAMGGFPETGQMFFARESGPELVGTIGGHTAVANNNDIVAAVSQGVASAVASVMGSGSSGQNIAVNVDGRNLFNIMVNQNNAYVRQTGASPLLV